MNLKDLLFSVDDDDVFYLHYKDLQLKIGDKQEIPGFIDNLVQHLRQIETELIENY